MIDVYPLTEDLSCSERGCVLPAIVLLSDPWGLIPVCRTHRDGLLAGRSLEDRFVSRMNEIGRQFVAENGRNFKYGDRRNGTDILDLDDLPGRCLPVVAQHGVFGLLTPESKLIEFGRRLLLGGAPSVTARAVGIDPRTAKIFMDRAGLPKPEYRDFKAEVYSVITGQPTSTQEIIKITGFTWSTVSRHLKRLMMDGKVKRDGWLYAAVALSEPSAVSTHLSIKKQPIRSDFSIVNKPHYHKPTFEELVSDSTLGLTTDAYNNRRNWGETTKRQWRDTEVGVDKNMRAPHESRGGVNKKRGKRRGAHAS